MPFGNNSLVLTYSPGQKGEEVEMRFNGLDALAVVGVGEGWEDRTGGAVLVSMAETWGKNRSVLVLSDRTYGANGQNTTQSITFRYTITRPSCQTSRLDIFDMSYWINSWSFGMFRQNQS
jgi:hypothetical protein